MSHVRNLLRKDSLQWTDMHETELQLLMKTIIKDANIQYSNPKKPVILQVDSS